MGFWANGLVMILLHFSPSLASLAAQEYAKEHPAQVARLEKKILHKIHAKQH